MNAFFLSHWLRFCFTFILFKLDLIVYVDPVNYYNMPYRDKYKVATAIGTLNWNMRGKNKKLLLMVPGRIGTTSPELGVPTAFSDISEFEAICEIANSKAGYNPELSYGSHFFQDLVESGILYNAIFENERTIKYDTGIFSKYNNVAKEYTNADEELKDILFAYDVSGCNMWLFNDMKNNHVIVYC